MNSLVRGLLPLMVSFYCLLGSLSVCFSIPNTLIGGGGAGKIGWTEGLGVLFSSKMRVSHREGGELVLVALDSTRG